jgi:hypothetical protein
MCLEYIRALIENDFKDFTLHQAFTGNWPEAEKDIQQYENKNLDYDVNLIMLTADNVNVFCEPNKKNILFTMWETDRIPSHWTELCNRCDAVVVPSTFCQDVFKKSGVTVPVHILPIPTDVHKFEKVQVNPDLVEMTEGKLIFYSIFQWGERKNPKALLNSYYSSFGSKDDVLLIIKTHINGTDNEHLEVENKVKSIRNNIKRNGSDYPKVMLISNNLNEDQIAQMHKVGNIYLSSTRGEGWNLPAFDAALAGNHIIATAFSSHMDFIDTYNHFKYQIYNRVPFQLEHCHNAGQLYTANQKWASVNIHEFSNRMKMAYEDWKQNGKLTLQNRRDEYSNYLKTRYSRKEIGQKLLAIIKEIA